MRHLDVLSPHRDDAVFSLSIALRKWAGERIHVRVLNFFTVSAYGPRAIGHEFSASEISYQRKREDRAALRALDPAIEVRDYSFIDAPLRLRLPVEKVMDSHSTTVRESDIAAISRQLPRRCTLAPLALGDHVDHRTVREAAMVAVPSYRLAFYEDLPYASWTAEELISERVIDIEKRLKRRFRPFIIRTRFGQRQRRRALAFYATQIAREEADRIASYAAKYRDGARIWVPEHSARWVAL